MQQAVSLLSFSSEVIHSMTENYTLIILYTITFYGKNKNKYKNAVLQLASIKNMHYMQVRCLHFV